MGHQPELPMRLTLLLALFTLTLSGPAALAQSGAGPCSDARLALANGSDEAVNRIETCLENAELQPEEEVEIYALLGAAHLAQGEYGDALTALNLAFAIADTQLAEIREPSTWRNRGIARAQLGLNETAMSDLLHAAAAMPDDVLTWLNLGLLYQDLDHHADAVVAYDHIVRLEPDWTGAWINRSGAFLDMGMTAAAVEDARRAVELDPASGTSLNMLCWTLIQDNRASLALPLCEQAVAAEPEIGAIVHSHAAALEAVGRMDEARPLYLRAWQLSPEDPEITADYERSQNP
jgi:tetratricopeptide (TPR) repeat protein